MINGMDYSLTLLNTGLSCDNEIVLSRTGKHLINGIDYALTLFKIGLSCDHEIVLGRIGKRSFD